MWMVMVMAGLAVLGWYGYKQGWFGNLVADVHKATKTPKPTDTGASGPTGTAA